jgi:hypothetical protein
VRVDAEQIVRALAAVERPITVEGGLVRCVLCGEMLDGGQHDPDCPWRLAREWVKARGADGAGAGGQVLD